MDEGPQRLVNRLYNDLPVTRLSLYNFNRLARAIWAAKGSDAFIKFVLCGEYVNELGELRQAFLDPLANAVPQDHRLKISRDYDSLLGICDQFAVSDNISVFAVPHPTFALKSSVHITRLLHAEGDEYDDVELHRIPNFEFGKFGPRHHLHIFFPDLWTRERAKGSQPYLLTQREREIWYEFGFRPAIVSLLDEHMASEWPATVETEAIRARTARGTYSWATKVIPDHIVPLLADRIRREFRRNPDISVEDRQWACTFFILHTVRGTKTITYHSTDRVSADYYLHKFLRDSHITRDVLTIGDWYIDVAIEISSDKGDCILWTTAGHQRFVQQAMRINEAKAERITSVNSSRYSRDYTSHLSALSGCRIVPGLRAEGEFQVKYLQMYTTDKAVTYNNDGRHHGKFITTKEAMGQVHPTPMINGLHTIFDEARVHNGCNARAEFRVPIEFAREVLLEFEATEVRRCLCNFSRSTWWSFRITRLMGASQVLSLQAIGPPELRVQPQALTLLAACVWLINGLHSRPEDGPAARRLMDASLPVTEADDAGLDTIAYCRSLPRQLIIRREDREEGDEDLEDLDDDDEHIYVEVAYNPYGVVFFRRIQILDIPRFRYGGPVMLVSAFYFWFGASIEEIAAKYGATGIIDRDVVARTRCTSNKRKLPITLPPTDEPLPDLFAIGAPDAMLPPPALDAGSDVEDAETPPPPEHLDKFLTDVFRMFVINAISKSPNPRGNTKPSYIKIPRIERSTVTEDVFKNPVLSDIFTDVVYKVTPVRDWEQPFKWLFPKAGHETASNIQNYPSSPYYRKWLAFVNNPEIDKETIEAARKAIWKRITTWTWIPDAQQDKMWTTSVRNVTGYIRKPEMMLEGRLAPAPRILIKQGSEFFFHLEEA